MDAEIGLVHAYHYSKVISCLIKVKLNGQNDRNLKVSLQQPGNKSQITQSNCLYYSCVSRLE